MDKTRFFQNDLKKTAFPEKPIFSKIKAKKCELFKYRNIDIYGLKDKKQLVSRNVVFVEMLIFRIYCEKKLFLKVIGKYRNFPRIVDVFGKMGKKKKQVFQRHLKNFRL